MCRKCYPLVAAQTSSEVAQIATFGGKGSAFCDLGGSAYVLSRHTTEGARYYPLFLRSFQLLAPHKLVEAEKFNLQYTDASQLTTIPDKLRWYRYQKALRQRDVADYLGIHRSTYVHYEEDGVDYYPIENMEKLAQLYEIPVTELLDDYNLFLYQGQGRQLRERRLSLNLTQSAFAKQLGVPLWSIKKWEYERVQITKSSWERYFK